MLRQYYRALFATTGDLSAGNLGPYSDKGDNDVGLLQDFATGVFGTSKPRAVWFQGSNFLSGQITGGVVGHPTFPTTFFGAGLVSDDYRTFAGNTNDIVDLTPQPPLPNELYSVASTCVTSNDVLSTAGTFGATMMARYANGTTGANPKIASIYAPSTYPTTTDHEAMTLVDGWRISSLGTWQTLTSTGRIQYFYGVLTSLFASLNCGLAQCVCDAVESPNNPLPYALALRSQNPMIDGPARITFSISRREKVEVRLYDAAGRQVRTLANREFAAGEHDLYWDGLDDAGRPVPRGVYFYQMRTPTFVSQKKLAVLRH
jgi:hypothetical protein